MSDVDLDQLADFVGGALDGTASADQIRDRIAGEPEWAEAYERLIAADEEIRLALRLTADHAEQMPSEVTARLLDALGSRSGPEDGPRVRRQRWRRSGGPAAPGSPPRLPPGESRRPPRLAGRRHRWLATLTAVVAFALSGLGASLLLDRDERATSPAMIQDGAPTSLREDAGVAASRLTRSSGNDYGRATLLAKTAEVEATSGRATTAAGKPEASEKALTKTRAVSGAPKELDRLADPVALETCLSTVLATHGGTVFLVDYARFESRPALITVLAGTPGADRVVVVVGPECGLGKGWSDERYVAQR